MKQPPITPLLLGLLVVSSCSGPGGGANPQVLWLAPDMMETRVKLVDAEPEPF